MPEVFQLMVQTQLGAYSSALHISLDDVKFALKVLHEIVCLQRLHLPRDELGIPLLHTMERQGIGLAAGASLVVRASRQGELAARLVMKYTVAFLV